MWPTDLPGEIETGIVSEIRIGVLLKTDNEFIICPTNVVIHVMERGSDGKMGNGFTVSQGGAFVKANSAIFEFVSEKLPLKYQHFSPKDVIDNFDIYRSKTLVDINTKCGVFD